MIIWLASYPKSGNTWVKFFLKSYFSSTNKELSLKTHIDDEFKIETFPTLNLLKENKIDYLKFENIVKNWINLQNFLNLNNKINFLKTHNAMCTINGHAFTNFKNTIGAIYIVRDPRDIVLSYANHFQVDNETAVKHMMDSKNGEFKNDGSNNFHRSLMGSWSDNYNSWKNYKGRELIIVKYEDLINNTFASFSRIVNYLNKINKTPFDENKIKISINKSSFENLRKLEEKEGFEEKGKGLFFFRKGKIGAWKHDLDKNLIREVENKFGKEMRELGYI